MARARPEEKYNYVLDYIEEAANARVPLKNKIVRVVRAYEGYPMINHYMAKLQSYRGYIQENYPDRLAQFDSFCQEAQGERNFTLHDAIETNTSMIMGGAGQFEFEPYDEYQDYDPELIDKLSAFASFFYKDNKIDSLAGTMGRNLNTQGGAYYYLQHDKESNKLRATLIDAWRMLLDPFRFKSNRSRYIGFTQTESWSSMKDHVKKEGKKGYILKSINQVDTYLNNVKDFVNGVDRESWDFPTDLLSRHVDMFWPSYTGAVMGRAEKGSNTKDDDKPPVDVMGYQADDVEVSYVNDLSSDMYFIVINRHFIVVARKNDLKKTIDCKTYDRKGKPVTRQKEIKLSDPFVEIPYIKTTWSTYPISPAFLVLDDFDHIVSMETVMQHNFSVMAPITFVGSSYDAEKMAASVGIPGEFVEGTMEQVGVLSKNHDMSSVIASIQRREEKIKKILRATDPFEVQAMIGNRATASEVGQAGGAVSQGLNSVLANIEDGMSELMQKMINMYFIFTDEDTISFPYNCRYHELDKEDLLGQSIIRVRLKSAIKLEQAQQSQNAIQVLGFAANNEAIDKKVAYGTLIPIATQGVVSRQQAEKMVLPQFKVDPSMLKMASDLKEQEKKQRNPADDIQIPEDVDVAALEQELLDAAIGGGMGGMPPMGAAGVIEQPPVQTIDPATGQPMMDPAMMAGAMGAPMGDPMGAMPPDAGMMPAEMPMPDPMAGPAMAPGTMPADAGIIANRPM